MATFRLLQDQVFEITKELNPGVEDKAQHKACDCYFQEISETKPPLFQFETQPQQKSKFPIKPRNSKVAIEDGKLTIVTYGGNSFKHCTERNLTKIFALDQGFIAQGAPKTCADNEEGQYVKQYCSLNGHPLNPIQPIKLHLFDHDDFIDLFNEHTPFKIVGVCNDYPFVLVYNWFNKYCSVCILTEQSKADSQSRQVELDFNFSPNLILDQVFRLEEKIEPTKIFLVPALRQQQLDLFGWLGLYFKNSKSLKFIQVKLSSSFPRGCFQVKKELSGVKSLILLNAIGRRQNCEERVAQLSIKRLEFEHNQACRCLSERLKQIKTAELVLLTQMDSLEIFSGAYSVLTLNNVSRHFNRKTASLKKDTSSAQELFNEQNSKFTIRFSDQKISRVNFDLGMTWPLSRPILECLQITLSQDAFFILFKHFLLLKFQGSASEQELLTTFILMVSNCKNVAQSKLSKKSQIISDQSWELLTTPVAESAHIYEKSNLLSQNGFNLSHLQNLLNKKKDEFFELLCLLFEDLKLNTYYLRLQKQLALILFQLSCSFGISKLNHLERYASEIDSVPPFNDQKWESSISKPEFAPSITSWTQHRMLGQQIRQPYQIAFERTRKFLKFINVLMDSESDKMTTFLVLPNNGRIFEKSGESDKLNGSIFTTRAELETHTYGHCNEGKKSKRLMEVIRSENLKLIIDSLPLAYKLLFIEVINFAKEDLGGEDLELSVEVYKLLGRKDLVYNYGMEECVCKEGSHGVKLMISQTRKIMQRSLQHAINGAFAQQNGKSEEPAQRSRFEQNDSRFLEARFLLDPTQSMRVELDSRTGGNHDMLDQVQLEQERQRVLQELIHKQLAKCVGWAALRLASLSSLPASKLQLPQISLTGYIDTEKERLSVALKQETHESLPVQWPLFHLGVAEGFRLLSKTLMFPEDTESQFLKMFRRNCLQSHSADPKPRYELAGHKLALGLLGHLDVAMRTDDYLSLKKAHDATTIATLIGRAASKLGSMDQYLVRSAMLHIPHLLPARYEIEMSLPVQAASVFSLGLLHVQTQDRATSEMLIAQIGIEPLSNKLIQRESFILASGFALGLTHLASAGKAQNVQDLNLENRLVRFIEGGHKMEPPLSANTNNTSNLESWEEGTQTHAHSFAQPKCSSVLEGMEVNVELTAPGALMALALMHLRSENAKIAKQIKIPSNFYELEYAKPSHLLLKILARNLILWSKIKPTEDWLRGQIPDIIHEVFNCDADKLPSTYSRVFDGDGLDFPTFALSYVNILAGGILSLALKYAGSSSPDVASLIMQTLNLFLGIPIARHQATFSGAGSGANSDNKNAVDRRTKFKVISCCALALGLVMSGTGDLETFRLLRIARKVIEIPLTESSSSNSMADYGYHQAIGMSIGFLFLGQGALTFDSSEPLSVASLLIAIYPQFTGDANLNRYYLQALRHMYVLAVRPNLLQVRDAESGKLIEGAQLQLHYTAEQALNDESDSLIRQAISPCQLNLVISHDSDSLLRLVKVSCSDPQYFPVSITNIRSSSLFQRSTIYLQRKIEHSQENKAKQQYNLRNPKAITMAIQNLLATPAPPSPYSDPKSPLKQGVFRVAHEEQEISIQQLLKGRQQAKILSSKLILEQPSEIQNERSSSSFSEVKNTLNSYLLQPSVWNIEQLNLIYTIYTSLFDTHETLISNCSLLKIQNLFDSLEEKLDQIPSQVNSYLKTYRTFIQNPQRVDHFVGELMKFWSADHNPLALLRGCDRLLSAGDLLNLIDELSQCQGNREQFQAVLGKWTIAVAPRKSSLVEKTIESLVE